MLMLGPIGFAAPWVLTALIALPILWVILRAMPPAPRLEIPWFPTSPARFFAERERYRFGIGKAAHPPAAASTHAVPSPPLTLAASPPHRRSATPPP